MFKRKKTDLEATFGSDTWGRLVEKFTEEGATRFATAMIEEQAVTWAQAKGQGHSARDIAAFSAATAIKTAGLPPELQSDLTERFASLLD